MLTNKFEGHEIKKCRVHEFMRSERNLSMKQTTCWPEARTSKENVQKRYDWVVKWSNTNMDFSRNCIFIDKAGFDINRRASRAWAPMVWGCLWGGGFGPLEIIDTSSINQEIYINILANKFHPWFTNVTMHQERDFIFQEDEASCHIGGYAR
ncbi:hypothetical protein G6F37_011604 [Rhizopus arrhizus]|nr:hypothetical protein G6F38_011709 [Rhizopus arrhizus]KAG1148452.1 hypothetical protein G6F37_011604 [Rhizopus arrhizus]